MPVQPHQVHSLRRHLRSLRRGRKYVTGPARHHQPPHRGPLISEPGPVDFRQYGVVARMWMEQVRYIVGVGVATAVGAIATPRLQKSPK